MEHFQEKRDHRDRQRISEGSEAWWDAFFSSGLTHAQLVSPSSDCGADLRAKRGRTHLPLHPPEVSLLRSKEWIERLLGEAGFALESYQFNWRDLWVQAVVTARSSA